jgi:hypothetical protein
MARPDKTIKKLELDLLGARVTVDSLVDSLPEANFQMALLNYPPGIAMRVQGAVAAGFGQEAYDLVQKELGRPRQSERAEALRNRILEAALGQSPAPRASETKFCVACGKPIPAESSFCALCGAKTLGTQPSPAPSPTPIAVPVQVPVPVPSPAFPLVPTGSYAAATPAPKAAPPAAPAFAPAPYSAPRPKSRRTAYLVAAAAVAVIAVFTVLGLALGGVFDRDSDGLLGLPDYEDTGDLTPDMIIYLADWGDAADLTVRAYQVFGEWAAAVIDNSGAGSINPDSSMGCLCVFRLDGSEWTLFDQASFMGAPALITNLRADGVPESVVAWLEGSSGASTAIAAATTTSLDTGWVCTPFGGMITLPAGWETIEPSIGAYNVAHYEAHGPDGMKIVFDTDHQYGQDPWKRAQSQDYQYARDASGHPGYQTVYLGRDTYCGYEGARLEFTTNTRYVLDYHFVVPGQPQAACAAIYPPAGGEAAHQLAMSILSTFRVP